MNQVIPDYLKPTIDEIDKKINETKSLLSDPIVSEIASEEIKKLEQEKTELLSSTNY